MCTSQLSRQVSQHGSTAGYSRRPDAAWRLADAASFTESCRLHACISGALHRVGGRARRLLGSMLHQPRLRGTAACHAGECWGTVAVCRVSIVVSIW